MAALRKREADGIVTGAIMSRNPSIDPAYVLRMAGPEADGVAALIRERQAGAVR